MSHPLFQRLLDAGLPELNEAQFEAYVQAQDFCVLFFREEPQRFPESLDVAVVLPELLKAFPMLKAALVERSLEPSLQAQYGFTLWPTLVFLKQGQYLGHLSRILNWDEYQTQIAELLARSPQIPVRRLDQTASVSSCSASESSL